MHIQTFEEFGGNDFAGIEKLIGALDRTGKLYDIDKIKKAYLFAKELHIFLPFLQRYRC